MPQPDRPVSLWPLAAYAVTSGAAVVAAALYLGRLLPSSWSDWAVVGAQVATVGVLVLLAGSVAPPILGWVRRRGGDRRGHPL